MTGSLLILMAHTLTPNIRLFDLKVCMLLNNATRKPHGLLTGTERKLLPTGMKHIWIPWTWGRVPEMSLTSQKKLYLASINSREALLFVPFFFFFLAF